MEVKGYLLYDINRKQYFVSIYNSGNDMFTIDVRDAKVFDDKQTLFATLELLRGDKISCFIPYVSVIEVY